MKLINLPFEIIVSCLYFVTDYNDLKNISNVNSTLNSTVAYATKYTIVSKLMSFIKFQNGHVVNYCLGDAHKMIVKNGVCILYSTQDPPIVVVMEKINCHKMVIEYNFIKCFQSEKGDLLLTFCSTTMGGMINLLFDGHNISDIFFPPYENLLPGETYTEYSMPILSSEIRLFYDRNNDFQNKYLLYVSRFSFFVKLFSNCIIRLTDYKQLTEETISFGLIFCSTSSKFDNAVYHCTCYMNPSDVKFQINYTVDIQSKDIHFFTFADLGKDCVSFQKVSLFHELTIFRKNFNSPKSLMFKVKNSKPQKTYIKTIKINTIDTLNDDTE